MANDGLTPIGRSAPPRAAMLVEALRGLGHSFVTALADIVDNSIAAEASRIDVAFTWNGERSCITVVDDGVGMSDAELERLLLFGRASLPWVLVALVVFFTGFNVLESTLPSLISRRAPADVKGTAMGI